MSGQIIFDLGELRQHDIAFPLSLAEKYRPQRLEQLRETAGSEESLVLAAQGSPALQSHVCRATGNR